MAIWDKITTGGNVEDRRGNTPGMAITGAGGLIAMLLAIGLSFMGLNISPNTIEEMLNNMSSLVPQSAQQQEQPEEFRGADSYEVFASRVLGSANQMWSAVFAENGYRYQEPRLVLFRDVTNSGCGIATSQVGPHYCPNDQTIYLDETFFDELHQQFGASKGEVAQAYVISHEVGHHVQNLLGALGSSYGSQDEMINLELQSDCYAGVWAYSVDRLGVFESDKEIEEALSAASAVGDDHIQEKTTGRVDRESWTHGSSDQRVNAFKTGYSTGNPGQCVDLQ